MYRKLRKSFESFGGKMKFTDVQILAKLFKDVYKEYLIYDEDKNVNESSLRNLKGEIEDAFCGKKFSIVAAVLCHKVGIQVKNIDNPNFNFNNITEKDYQSNSFIIQEDL